MHKEIHNKILTYLIIPTLAIYHQQTKFKA